MRSACIKHAKDMKGPDRGVGMYQEQAKSLPSTAGQVPAELPSWLCGPRPPRRPERPHAPRTPADKCLNEECIGCRVSRGGHTSTCDGHREEAG